MKIERRKNRAAEVYTASLNDIMFFLLLFFLIVSTMVTPAAIRVLLPNSSTAEKVATKKNITLIITSDLQYYVNDSPVTFEGLEPALIAAIGERQEGDDINVLLQADKMLNLQDIVNVIDIGNKLRVKMVLFTEKNN
ncbi:ExbD/TolR family protein [Dysgonomonas macrotermitis]|uniref:Biopolymer transport protein ExbD n=1 Tax=Dysgonomonas macrotermitis TaxID=1346286 RepID=A0A1M5DD02_9BACT|nr:biopolymer transporter ExbD [Dysgonomonas macrotermitis]SHF64958.1 biopolymer transport protein ExbD [Dysgonomonas macrotermitis]